jgi:GNAT superfamily N-acetyltransferase
MTNDLGLSHRSANLADLPALLALINDDVLGKNRDLLARAEEPGYQAAWRAIAGDPNQHLMVVELNREVIAMAHLTFIPGLSRKGAWRMNVEAVRVRAALRGQGIGAWMMREAEAIARSRGCALVQLTSDIRREDTHRFYTRLGYVASHVGFKRSIEGKR